MPEQSTNISTQEPPPRSGHWVVICIVALGLATIGAFGYLKFTELPSLSLRTCFQDVAGLKAGAAVRLAGVEIGRVHSVRAQPSDHTCPAAVDMQLQAEYELKIPKDSVASVGTEGVLGQPYLKIDASKASGQPIQSGGQLPSEESVKYSPLPLSLDRVVRAVEVLKELSDEEKAAQSSAPDKKAPEAPRRPSAK